MKRVPTIVKATLLAAVALVCAGCGTGRCPMVCFTPRGPTQLQEPVQVLEGLNSRVPFQVAADNFVANTQRGKPSYWVFLQTRDQERQIVRMLKRDRDLKFVSVGYVSPEFRQVFGVGKTSAVR